MNLNGAITSRHSTKRLLNGQFVRRHLSAFRAAGGTLLCVLTLAATACTSIYHRTQSGLPPDPAAELELRIREARQAADQADQAARKLLGHLRQPKADAIISADFDRLEAAAYEVERRALAARDAGGPPDGRPDTAAAIEPILKRAETWLAYVQSHRSADRATQIVRLEALLAGAGKSSS